MMPPDAYTMMNERMDRLETKLDTMIAHLLKHPPCPAPGACVDLGRRVEVAELALLEAQKRLARLERWQAAMMSVIAAIGFIVAPILAIFGPAIRIRFGLP